MRSETRPWGRFEVIDESETHWLKRIYIAPGQSLSLQVHARRDEYWQVDETGARAVLGAEDFELAPGAAYYCERGTEHRLYNPCEREVVVLEYAVGSPDEADIERLADNYGR